MFRLHERMSRIDSSGIRKVFDLAATMDDPINLSIGQPDFDVPEPVKEAAIAAIRAGKNRYTLTQGTEGLRRGVREHLAATKGIEAKPEEIMISSGVSGGLVLAFLAAFGAGDEVIVPDPYFVMYKHLLRIFDATPVYADTYPDFQLTAERVAPLITPRTRAIIVGSPANPTGVVLTEESWRGLIELARKHDLLIISDEIYDAFVYDRRPFSPGAEHDRVLTLGGFSKSHAMTGWRLGYAAGPAELIRAMITLQQYTFVCAPSMVQEAAADAALALSTAGHRELYRARRDRMLEALAGKYRIAGAQGAFYLFIEVPESAAPNATEFSLRAIREKKLLVIPGNVFSERDTHFRLSYAASDAMIDRGLEALLALAD